MLRFPTLNQIIVCCNKSFTSLHLVVCCVSDDVLSQISSSSKTMKQDSKDDGVDDDDCGVDCADDDKFAVHDADDEYCDLDEKR